MEFGKGLRGRFSGPRNLYRLEKFLSFVLKGIGRVLIFGIPIKNLKYGGGKSRIGEEEAAGLGTRRPASGAVISVEM